MSIIGYGTAQFKLDIRTRVLVPSTVAREVYKGTREFLVSAQSVTCI